MEIPRWLLLLTSCMLVHCSQRSGNAGACGALIGAWEGVALEARPGSDPDAIRVMSEVLRAERWRILRVTPTAMQRERVGLAGGRPVGEAMYIREERPDRCVVELRAVQSTRILTFQPRPDGSLLVETQGSWFTAQYRRR